MNKNIAAPDKSIGIHLLPTRPGIIPFFRKFIVTSPLQKILLVKFRDPFRPITGPLPAPTSNSNQPLFTNRRPDIIKPPVNTYV